MVSWRATKIGQFKFCRRPFWTVSGRQNEAMLNVVKCWEVDICRSYWSPRQALVLVFAAPPYSRMNISTTVQDHMYMKMGTRNKAIKPTHHTYICNHSYIYLDTYMYFRSMYFICIWNHCSFHMHRCNISVCSSTCLCSEPAVLVFIASFNLKKYVCGLGDCLD